MKDLGILIVDDNAKYAGWLERVLAYKGYTHVQTVSNPWQALAAIEKERPRLVLLDLYLPGMDGLHLLTAIHKIDKNIPVVMLTCETDEECVHAAASLGAADYLTKPLRLEQLYSSLETYQ